MSHEDITAICALDKAHEELSTLIHSKLNNDSPYAVGGIEKVSSFTSTLMDRFVGEGYDCELSSIPHYPYTPEVLVRVVDSIPRIRVRYCMESTWTRWDYNLTTPISPYYTVSTYYGNYGWRVVGIQALLNELPRIGDWVLMKRQCKSCHYIDKDAWWRSEWYCGLGLDGVPNCSRYRERSE
ncbi:hypothetical protein [Microcoleus phage My-WqHQDG]|nr:hypothetical protein [Microcoleus phage My-WqHQDG]